MTDLSFRRHTVASAPVLAAHERHLGFVPNALATMAESPELVEAFGHANAAFERSSLSRLERESLVLAVARVFGCEYCLAWHRRLLKQLDSRLVVPLLEGSSTGDERLDALRAFATEVVKTHGGPTEATLARFFAAGYTKRQALEVVLGVGSLTLSAFSNRLTRAEVDDALRAE